MGEEQDKMEEWVADNLSEQRDEVCACTYLILFMEAHGYFNLCFSELPCFMYTVCMYCPYYVFIWQICALQSIFDDAGILEVLSVPCGSGKDTDSHLGACAAVSSDEQSLYAVKVSWCTVLCDMLLSHSVSFLLWQLTIPLPLESDEIKLNVWVQNDHDANGVALQHTANVPKPCKPEFSRSLSGEPAPVRNMV